MIARFTGASGAPTLRSALLQQRIIQNNEVFADMLITKGVVTEFRPGDVIIEQGHADEFVFFALTGRMSIHVNGREMAIRVATECIGEMSAIDPTSPRSATVTAVETVIALRVPSADFNAIVDANPVVWRPIARVLCERLGQRKRFHRPPNPKPILFIGSSKEGLPVARQIQVGLEYEPFETRVWTNGLFGPGGVPVDALLKQAADADFALFVFGRDDKIAARAEEHYAPRDNVVFEMGMFISQLGRERCFMIVERSSDVKIPSDLLGIVPLTYKSDASSNPQVVFAPVCTRLAELVKSQGPM